MAACQSYPLAKVPRISSYAAIVGPREGQGPLSEWFDCILPEDTLGESSFEKSETRLLITTAERALERAGVKPEQVSMLLAGDLLNQIISSGFAARQLKIPFLGLYGACSTMAESLAVGAMLYSGGFGERILCATGSHFSTAERQYRTPLEMGCQRPPTAQRTVTGAGAVLLGERGSVGLSRVTLGRVIDLGVTDPNQMGAAMAPAAADTLLAHFAATGERPEDYDLIVTGDLGRVGADILLELTAQQGLPLTSRLMDCGAEIFRGLERVDAGGSGCGCSASVLSAMILPRMERGELSRVLFAATGALLSLTSSQQRESIPGIAHAVVLEVM